MTLIHHFAPAKLNLYLHVTGRRADGYHHLDSLVAFASIGDEVGLRPFSDRLKQKFILEIVGPQAVALRDEDPDDNLVVKAVRSFAHLAEREIDAALILIKNLPVASGIGGGSSDAAAALRALAQHWGLPQDDPRLLQAAALHGQDVPVCLNPQNLYMTATGTAPAPPLPRADIVLVNPGHGLPTPAVYKEYRQGGDAFSPPARLETTPASVAELVAALSARGNDLYAPACRLMPEIGAVMTGLRGTDGCLLARMSGSGATCFGIYADALSARAAAQKIKSAHPNWWVEAGAINE